MTRPSVFRTQDAHGSAASGDYSASPAFSTPYAQHAALHSHAAVAGDVAAEFQVRTPTAAGTGYGSAGERQPRPLNGFGADDALGAAATAASLNPRELPRQSSVRTFSQLSAVPITSPTAAFFPAESPLPAWGDYNRSAPMSPAEGLGNGLFGAEMLVQRPLGPDSIREGIYAYLEATDRHDVVMAMLADERRHTQRSNAAAAHTSTAAGLSFSFSPSLSAQAPPPPPPPLPRSPEGDAFVAPTAASGGGGETTSLHTSQSQVYSGITSLSGPSTSPSHLLTPPREATSVGGGGVAGVAGGTPGLGGLEGRRSRQRRSHELLRKGLLDRRATERSLGEDAADSYGRASPQPSPGREDADLSPRPAFPAASPLDGTGRAASATAGAHAGKAVPPTQRQQQQQQLPKVLPALCGLEEAVRPDLVLLFADLERKIREQYRQLSIPPPSHEVLQYILTQAYEPMWSVGEDANAYHLFEPANPVTGMVLYGTLNQMVEQLTQVCVMPLSTPRDIVLKSERAFSQAFLRRHRLLMPSHVLLAKLMERYLVPLSLHLGFERFKAHGITVHAPGMGASLPPRRSQSETVLHGRRHPGANAAAAGNTTGATASASVSGQSNGAGSGESGVWGSRSARPSPHAGTGNNSSSNANAALRPSTNAVVEEYVRATAAATSPDAAVIAMVRSGLFPALTNDSIAALTNAAMGTAPMSNLTSYPASTTLPHRNALSSFPNVAAAAAAAAGVTAGGAHGFGSLFNGAASRPAVELVTTYSPSAALWLTVCEKVQLKVLSVLLYWLQHHPHHFDGEMLRSVLHFVECCCYGTCEWADAPSRQPQIAEFIRQACHAALPLTPSVRRQSGGGGAAPPPPPPLAGAFTSPHVMSTAAQFAAFPPISREWREGVLSGTWERRRYQLLSEAVPPSLRQSVKAELLPWTWITPMGSLTPREYLPCFAFRALPSADIMSYAGEDRHAQFAQRGPSRSGTVSGGGAGGGGTAAGAGGAAPSDTRGGGGGGGGPDVSTLHAAAQEALRLFGSCTFETYVRGLTAAHYRMFTAFPSQDIFIAAQHTSSSYLSSPVFQSSFLGRFLNSSAFLTSWGVSLLLHAAYLDGERAAAVVAVTNMSILNSFVGDGTDYRALVASEGGGVGGDGDVAAAARHSRASSVSAGNSSLSTGSAATASVGASSQNGGGAGGSAHEGADAGGAASTVAAAAAAAAAARLGGFVHNPARHFLHVLDRLVDLVVGFLRVNNLHASYSIFRAFTHPFVKKLRQHRRVVTHVHAQTAHRIRKLEGFFLSIPPSAASGASGRSGSGGGAGAGKHVSGSAAAAAGVGDPAVDDELDTAAEGTTADAAAAATPSGSPSAAPAPRKAHHSFFEYLNTVPDSVEYPTVPVVQYYLRELQMMFALEPTFFTVPSHQMQSRFVSEEVRLTGVFTVPRAGLEEEQTPTAASPIAVVNWRKMHLVDDWIQRVNSNQMSCLHYISSRSTVVRNIMPDLDFEKAFDAQLSRVVVTNTSLLQDMANQLYSAL